PPTVQRVVAGSPIHARYAQPVDPDSAYERLTARLQQAEVESPIPAPAPQPPDARDAEEREPARRSPAPQGGVDTGDLVQMGQAPLKFMNSPAGREIQRSIFG